MANFNFNKVILGGRLTRDPELKQTPNGVKVTQFSVAVNRRGGGEQETDFFNVTAWRNTAEFITKFFRKGSSICITGSIQTRSWTDNDGNKRSVVEIVADEATFVDGKNDNAAVSEDVKPSYMPEAYSSPKLEEITDEDDLPF